MKKSTVRTMLAMLLSLLMVVESGFSIVVFAEADENSSDTEKGTEENLESVGNLVIASDANGNEVDIEEVDEAKYDGFLFKLKEDTTKSEIKEMKSELKQLDGSADAEEVIKNEVYSADSVETISEIADADTIEYVEPNYYVTLDSYDINKNTIEFAKQKKTIELMNIDDVWEKSIFGQSSDGKNVVVAVVDSLYSSTHPDLKDSLLPGIDAFNIDSYSDSDGDYVGHGTFVAGIIAAQHNDICVMGAMPKVKILPIRVFTEKKGSSTEVIFGLNEIYKRNDVDVVNMSFSFDGKSTTVETICDKLESEKGIILTASAGNLDVEKPNDDGTEVLYPAGSESVIGVGAVDDDGTWAESYSYHNKSVFVTAVGSAVTSTGIGNTGYSTKYGTSCSAPYVSALAAMVKSLDRSITSKDFQEILKSTSQDRGDPGYDVYYGYGIIDFEKVYDYLVEKISVAEENVAVSQESLTYDGNEKKPNITVTVEGAVLQEGKDYTLLYENNINAGTEAKVTVTGIGRYEGNVTKKFTINKADPSTPTNLTAMVCQTLGDVKLPAGYTWKKGSSTPVGEIGNREFLVDYRPVNDNYNAGTDIKVTVAVTDHEYNILNRDSSQHWYVCACGAESDHYGHAVVKVGKVNPTCCSVGYKAHYACPYCGLCYKDKKGKKTCSLSKYKIKKKKHSYTKKIVSPQYLKKSATKKSAAIYYKSCKWCGKKGKSTFKYGKKLS